MQSETGEPGGRTKVVFAETKPLPSYLVALGVGPFDFVDAGKPGKNHTPLRMITPKGKAAQAKYAAQVTGPLLAELEDYFGVPYPYEKLDILSVPFFGGAMENAGLILARVPGSPGGYRFDNQCLQHLVVHIGEFLDVEAALASGVLAELRDDVIGRAYGAAFSGGTVFKITPSGTLTTLSSFCAQSGCTDGENPEAALVQATNGEFYGTTSGGGANCVSDGGCGTVFKITPSGTLTTL